MSPEFSKSRSAPAPLAATKVTLTPKPKDNAAATRASAGIASMRHALIAEAAYFRSLNQAGSPVDHWLAAEKEVDARLMKARRP